MADAELTDNRIRGILNDPRFDAAFPGIKNAFRGAVKDADCGGCSRKQASTADLGLRAVKAYVLGMGDEAKRKFKQLLGVEKLLVRYRDGDRRPLERVI